jgi:hypothetical protein
MQAPLADFDQRPNLSLLEAYAVSERMNQYLLDNLDEAAWNVLPSAEAGSRLPGRP